jgi:hypothetical protein
MRKIFLLITLSLGLLANLHAQVSTAKRSEIEKYLRASGIERDALQSKKKIIGEYRLSNVYSPLFLDALEQKLNVQHLMSLIVPVYDKYFSIEEIESMTSFFQSLSGAKMVTGESYTREDAHAVTLFLDSPIGKKKAAVTQLMKSEIVEIGKKWGEKAGQEAGAISK